MNLNKILLLFILCGNVVFAVQSVKDDQYEIVRPTVLPILRGNEPLGVNYNWKQMLDVIRIAVVFLSPTGKNQLPSNIEIIVLVEEDDHWVVAMYNKGNSRTSVKRAGKDYVGFEYNGNPAVVCVDKKTLVAKKAPLVALGWPAPISSQIKVHYADETPAEKEERLRGAK